MFSLQAFADKFSRDLTAELRGTGVIVQVIWRCFIVTSAVNRLVQWDLYFILIADRITWLRHD